MTQPPRRVGVACAVLALTSVVAACGDDANDQAWLSQRAADRLAFQLAATSTTVASDAAESSTDAGGSPAATTVPTVEPTGVVIAVQAIDNTFRPQTVTVHVGDTVAWENRGRNEHNVLSVEGALEDGSGWGVQSVDFTAGTIWSRTFTEPGQYDYYCTIHGAPGVGMIGTVIVEP